MNLKTNEEFMAYLLGTVQKARALGYQPNEFERMLHRHGAFDAVKRVLGTGRVSSGFEELVLRGRFDLTCESVIVETKWRQYFDDDCVAIAERTLRRYGHPFKRFATEGETDDAQAITTLLDGLAVVGGGPTPETLATASSSNANLGINAFFAFVLKAPVSNPRWSWGAVDERSRRVFLRLWRMDVRTVADRLRISVIGTGGRERPGWRERERHIALVKAGYTAYGVLCDKDRPESGTILRFEHETLIRLGQLFEESGTTSMEIMETVPVQSAVADNPIQQIGDDLNALAEQHLAETTRAALIAARLGQGRFRRELLRRWDNACAVTGCRVGALLRASHSKPWRVSDNTERLDSNNGLVLVANLDALFDAGLIAFDDSGEMLVASVISAEEQKALGLPAKLTGMLKPRQKDFLRYHREHVFLQQNRTLG